MRIIGVTASFCCGLVLAACTVGAASGDQQEVGSAPAKVSAGQVASMTDADKAAMIAELRKNSYLPREDVPSSLLLNPAPPAPGSAAMARDEEAARAAVALVGTRRWEQAKIDADLFTPAVTGTFSCAAGFPISAETTPRLQHLLLKSMMVFGLSTYPTKTKYQRPRPFMANGKPTCTPDQEEVLRKDGSYPSGHSAIGYGMGLVLAEVVPDRAAQLVARGRAFGDSRRICNVHWLSDIEEGRVVASAVTARLNADPVFAADVAAARAEVVEVRGKLAVPECARENAALGS